MGITALAERMRSVGLHLHFCSVPNCLLAISSYIQRLSWIVSNSAWFKHFFLSVRYNHPSGIIDSETILT